MPIGGLTNVGRTSIAPRASFTAHVGYSYLLSHTTSGALYAHRSPAGRSATPRAELAVGGKPNLRVRLCQTKTRGKPGRGLTAAPRSRQSRRLNLLTRTGS